ncbi:MAG: Cro/C1-type DNA-binding domain [Blastocatellia bacterium]|jgi:transcriptional regulator with XRE-family HTH domain|nr:Cro/C1-type DNA-binding domain [Blastocatellia bacterium]
MKTRILKVNLRKHLKEKQLSQNALAAQIGIAPPTLAKMLNDEWEYVSRDSIERTIDYLGLEVADVFQLVNVEFWKPIEDRRQCTFLRGSHAHRPDEGMTIPGPDNDATQLVVPFVRRLATDSVRYIDHERDEEKLIELAKQENCIVIGSPKSNAATEILLSRFFGARPFSEEDRPRIPFGFCWPEITEVEKNSSLTCSDAARKRTGMKPGIAVKGGPLVEADYADHATFFQWAPGRRARDCGLVLVANRPFNTTEYVKLIVLAGFSGVGTIAAADALIEDFRYLEPTSEKENFVWGVVQAWYNKPANDDTREYKRFRWKYRTGIAPINEKSPVKLKRIRRQ